MNKPRQPRLNRKARRAEAQRAPQRETPVVSYWMVAFLDLLGYRQVLEDLDVMPLPEDEDGRARVRAALARAMRLRRRLHASFAQFTAAEHSTAPEDLDGVPPHLQAKARSLRAVRLVQSPGPDHYIVAASLSPSPNHFPVRAVYSVLGATASGMLMHLALGSEDPSDTLPLRGGIDIAAGAEVLPEKFLYSPALSRAYKLESEDAVYPRTLIGDRIRDFLRSVIARPGADVATAYARSMAERIETLFFVDRDGKVALDFYGPAARELFGSTPLAKDLAEKAWSYATAAERIHRTKGVPRIAQKYEWLVAYLSERRRHWQ